nr:ATPase, F1/V1/A1 complex, alpha/beta subunit, zinc knuckle CX2CX4HX4C [Tanacetum cinerariifolium]
ESGKEVVKDRIDYVNDEIYKNAEVSGDIEKNHDKVNGDMGMRMDKGISALASRLKRPIKIDQVTAEMCKNGVGRLGYARFLIKINTEDEFLDKIEINYLDKRRKVKSTKWVRVEYTWNPNRCNHCKVFGHLVQRCDAILNLNL